MSAIGYADTPKAGWEDRKRENGLSISKPTTGMLSSMKPSQRRSSPLNSPIRTAHLHGGYDEEKEHAGGENYCCCEVRSQHS